MAHISLRQAGRVGRAKGQGRPLIGQQYPGLDIRNNNKKHMIFCDRVRLRYRKDKHD